MGQSMVAITESDCTGCDLCIPHCPFEALLPLASNPKLRTHKKRPIVVVASQCVGCLSCIGSCPTGALFEVKIPVDASQSTLLMMPEPPETEPVNRWKKGGIGWA
ncbi:MAG: 4Fe-4S binding protein [Euryarchaeota archaeon]|jgi:NAD-dependent dihydropyrimidine dehydrogenase PreA subunit|nr:4Fe-4S binding protein [Euryarchaeota archaeon]MBT5595193.1 4Fe-4S binding protein [Euryarchaeota archaeon]MBT5843806.1 4Fe-4S binding protein [Euryarchaeota archaeon]MBT6641121.1 4Fe-4S binding protein [Euryarchaeota archaeon]MBT6844748.1 4Fe-4S binding protein [Euryarchaeota archaeon]